jgi:hypothetical protein
MKAEHVAVRVSARRLPGLTVLDVEAVSNNPFRVIKRSDSVGVKEALKANFSRR